MTSQVDTNKRNCDGCTACCNGTLPAKVLDFSLYRGSPCKFLCETGCSIHDTKPENPCTLFNCQWVLDATMPEWMKPSLSGIILDIRVNEKLMIMHMVENIEINPNAILECLHFAQLNDLSIQIFMNGEGKYSPRINAFIQTTDGALKIMQMSDAEIDENYFKNYLAEK